MFVVLGRAKRIAFTPSRLEVEQEVFHVQPELAECFLHEPQNALTPMCTFRDPIEQNGQRRPMFRGKTGDGLFLISQILWELLGVIVFDAGLSGHKHGS